MSTIAKRYFHEEEQTSLMETYSDLLNLSKTNKNQAESLSRIELRTYVKRSRLLSFQY